MSVLSSCISEMLLQVTEYNSEVNYITKLMKDESYPSDPAYRAQDNKIYAYDRKCALERMGKVWDKMGTHYLTEYVFPHAYFHFNKMTIKQIDLEHAANILDRVSSQHKIDYNLCDKTWKNNTYNYNIVAIVCLHIVMKFNHSSGYENPVFLNFPGYLKIFNDCCGHEGKKIFQTFLSNAKTTEESKRTREFVYSIIDKCERFILRIIDWRIAGLNITPQRIVSSFLHANCIIPNKNIKRMCYNKIDDKIVANVDYTNIEQFEEENSKILYDMLVEIMMFNDEEKLYSPDILAISSIIMTIAKTMTLSNCYSFEYFFNCMKKQCKYDVIKDTKIKSKVISCLRLFRNKQSEYTPYFSDDDDNKDDTFWHNIDILMERHKDECDVTELFHWNVQGNINNSNHTPVTKYNITDSNNVKRTVTGLNFTTQTVERNIKKSKPERPFLIKQKKINTNVPCPYATVHEHQRQRGRMRQTHIPKVSRKKRKYEDYSILKSNDRTDTTEPSSLWSSRSHSLHNVNPLFYRPTQKNNKKADIDSNLPPKKHQTRTIAYRQMMKALEKNSKRSKRK